MAFSTSSIFSNSLPQRKCCRDQNRRKSDGAISDEYGGWDSTSHLNSLIFSSVGLGLKIGSLDSIIHNTGLHKEFVQVSALQNEQLREYSTKTQKCLFVM